MNTDTALVPTNGEVLPVAQPTMIRPIATADEALEAWEAFQALKGKLVTADDIQHISGRDFIKKSGYLKIATAFGLNSEIVRAEKDDLTTKEGTAYFLWRITVRAIAPNGRYMEAVGACASIERQFAHKDADVFAQAQTRATNRAISNLIGGGAVSAEEMKAEAHLTPQQAKELLDQFVRSCDQQGVEFDYPTLASLLLQNADDLRRAFKHFKAKSDGADDESPSDD